MTRFASFASKCDVVDLSKFDGLTLPEYRTVEVIGIQNKKVNSINFKNLQGQIINLARSIGTDRENVRGILESLNVQGWDVTKIPPIVEEENNSLYDGFSRHEGLLEKNHEVAPYLVVRKKEEFTTDDVIDEIGLGANLHSQSKKATITDYKKRFRSFIIREEEKGNQITINDGIKWFASIPNSFSDEKIELAIEDVFAAENSRKNMESFTKKVAEQRGAELLNVNRKSVFAINKGKKSSSSTYFKRVLFDILDYFDENAEVPNIVGFLSKIEAEDSETKRDELRKDVEKLNRIMARVGDLYKKDPNFDFINLKGFIPQVIDEESTLIK
tara:strand:+ start:490 stop:1476 length:987 start_codon:yes stop_codon:yes gene_type:complete